MIMLFLFGVVLEVSTLNISEKIADNRKNKLLLKIFNEGYKVNRSNVGVFSRRTIVDMIKGNTLLSPMGLVSLYLKGVPGINILTELLISKNEVKQNYLKLRDEKEITPMDDHELAMYGGARGKKEKLSMIKEISKICDVKKNKTRVDVHKTYTQPINIDGRVLDKRFTKEEVERLNKTTKHSLRFGKINDENVAIIGIPNEEFLVKDVNISKDKENKSVEFTNMSNEDAELFQFSVYPYTKDDNYVINKEYKKIIEDRKNSETVNLFGRAILDSFSLDEVKKLNEKTNGDYQIGVLENMPFALVGVPEDFNVSHCRITNGGVSETYDFKKVNDEDVSDDKFVVYPYSGELEDMVYDSYGDILLDRDEKMSFDENTSLTENNKQTKVFKKNRENN